MESHVIAGLQVIKTFRNTISYAFVLENNSIFYRWFMLYRFLVNNDILVQTMASSISHVAAVEPQKKKKNQRELTIRKIACAMHKEHRDGQCSFGWARARRGRWLATPATDYARSSLFVSWKLVIRLAAGRRRKRSSCERKRPS